MAEQEAVAGELFGRRKEVPAKDWLGIVSRMWGWGLQLSGSYSKCIEEIRAQKLKQKIMTGESNH